MTNDEGELMTELRLTIWALAACTSHHLVKCSEKAKDGVISAAGLLRLHNVIGRMNKVGMSGSVTKTLN